MVLVYVPDDCAVVDTGVHHFPAYGESFLGRVRVLKRTCVRDDSRKDLGRDFFREGEPKVPDQREDQFADRAGLRIDPVDHPEVGVLLVVVDVDIDLTGQFLEAGALFIAAFEKNPEVVITALRSAIQLGLRDRQVFDDAIFEDLWDEPRFIVLQQELDEILAMEHDKVLQLICFNNPTPDNWQPLPDTCEGVEEKRVGFTARGSAPH